MGPSRDTQFSSPRQDITAESDKYIDSDTTPMIRQSVMGHQCRFDFDLMDSIAGALLLTITAQPHLPLLPQHHGSPKISFRTWLSDSISGSP